MKKTTNLNIISVLFALMVVIAACKGLYHPDVYLNTEPGILRLAGHQDFAILVIFVPLLLFSTWLTAQSHFRGTLLWIGTVGYLGYVYSGYSFGGVCGELFLLHTAITGLSFFLLFIKLANIDPETIRLRFIPVTPLRFTAFFMIGVAVLTEVIWFQEVLPIPKPLLSISVTDLKDFLALQVLDLAFLGPLTFLAGLWLYLHKAGGYVLTAGLLVIIPAKYGTMVTDLNLASIQGQANLVLVVLSVVALLMLVCFLKKLKEEKLTSFHNRISNQF
ncbi:MAG: hypothetical protein ACM3YE_02955 [Bacteroidota bacterium]